MLGPFVGTIPVAYLFLSLSVHEDRTLLATTSNYLPREGAGKTENIQKVSAVKAGDWPQSEVRWSFLNLEQLVTKQGPY